jgi:subtilisin-like proprotein convertase family protein
MPPAALVLSAIILHDHSGRGTDNLQRTYDLASIPDLARLKGNVPQRCWMLEASDQASQELGRFHSFSLEIVTASYAGSLG